MASTVQRIGTPPPWPIRTGASIVAIGARLLAAARSYSRKLAHLVDAGLGFFTSQSADVRRAQQLDMVWVEPNGPVACFEVESTMSMTSGLMQGFDVLGSVRRYLVIPEERGAQLAAKMPSPLFEEHFHERLLGSPCTSKTTPRRFMKDVGKFERLEGPQA